MMDYQQQLTERRRAATWRALETMRQAQQRHLAQFQGKRPDQREFSALVILWLAVVVALGFVAGAALALI